MEMERRIRAATRRREKNQVSPTMLFHFIPGQLVTRRHRVFSKLDPRTTGPFRVRRVTGTYRQRVQLEPIDASSSRKKKLIVHASQLVPFDRPYIGPGDIEVSPDAEPDPDELRPEPLPNQRASPDDPDAPTKKRRFATANNAWALARLL